MSLRHRLSQKVKALTAITIGKADAAIAAIQAIRILPT